MMLHSADILITLACLPVLAFFLVWVHRYMHWTSERIERAHEACREAKNKQIQREAHQ